VTHSEIRQKFLDFFVKRGHVVVPSSSLLPDDPSVLFTTAGMQQFKPYYTQPELAPSKNVVSIQKCIRTSDIDEVGDESHLTFFEMLGNFSFGGYFKKEAIAYAYEFITKEMGLEIDYVSVFGGEGDVPTDKESEEIWKSIDENIEVRKSGRADNFWGPTGDEGPCGPTTEIYVDGLEVWNIVFNQYYQQKDTKLELIKIPGIDTGMGLERLAMVSQKKSTIFETDLFTPITQALSSLGTREQRVIADHARACAFLIADGVQPSNKDQGYVLRRLLRRLMLPLGAVHKSIIEPFQIIVDHYNEFYPNLDKKTIIGVVQEEENRFSKTVTQGLKEIDKLKDINASAAFRLYESFGLPYEVIKDIAKEKAANLNRKDFDEEFKKHQEKSRAGAEKKFGGHGLLLDTGELRAANEEELKKVTRLHTATHLLQAALRKVLGDQVTQAGSDITAERLRFDFSFTRKMTDEEVTKIEQLVNEVIEQDLLVTKVTLPQDEAKKTGALHFFKIKYPEKVDVYSVGNFSKEFCGGPHVERTGVIGKLKITKEEAVSAGVRRIRATVE